MASNRSRACQYKAFVTHADTDGHGCWRRFAMVAATITVNQQTRNGDTTTPKGRTRRTVPMTSALHEALKRMETILRGVRGA
jgi:hypothetical protein